MHKAGRSFLFTCSFLYYQRWSVNERAIVTSNVGFGNGMCSRAAVILDYYRKKMFSYDAYMCFDYICTYTLLLLKALVWGKELGTIWPQCIYAYMCATEADALWMLYMWLPFKINS